MHCLKNYKKLWFIDWYGNHDMKIIDVYKFMSVSTNFIVDYQCKLCGAKQTKHFVEWDELLSQGLTNEQIQFVMDGNGFEFVEE